MSGYDFAGWVSKLCILDECDSDKDFVESLRAFANEAGVTLSDSDIRHHFRLNDGSLDDEMPKANEGSGS